MTWFRWLITRPRGQPSWERGQHCMRTRTRPDDTRPRPNILASKPRWPWELNFPGNTVEQHNVCADLRGTVVSSRICSTDANVDDDNLWCCMLRWCQPRHVGNLQVSSVCPSVRPSVLLNYVISLSKVNTDYLGVVDWGNSSLPLPAELPSPTIHVNLTITAIFQWVIVSERKKRNRKSYIIYVATQHNLA